MIKLQLKRKQALSCAFKRDIYGHIQIMTLAKLNLGRILYGSDAERQKYWRNIIFCPCSEVTGSKWQKLKPQVSGPNVDSQSRDIIEKWSLCMYRESKPQLITIFSRKWIMTTLFSRSRYDVFSALFSRTGAYKKIFVPIYAVTKAENLWNFWTMMNQTLISVEIPRDDNEFSQW